MRKKIFVGRSSLPLLTAGLLALLTPECKRAGGDVPAVASTPTPAQPALKAPAPARAKVSRIVFIDQEKCCACTRKRIDGSWKALLGVLGFPPTIALDRYHLDTQEKEAEPFLAKKPIVAAPGIYFLDGAGQILELLQGEVSEAQVRKVLP